MDCLICHETIRLDDSVKLTCKHIYHQSCIFKWMQMSNACPYCKAELYKNPRPKTVQIADLVIPRNVGIAFIAMFIFTGMLAQLILMNWMYEIK